MQTLQCLRIIKLIESSPRRKLYRQRFDPFSLDEEDFKARYRFSKSTAKFIINLLREELHLNTKGLGTSPELQVLTAIRYWGRRGVQEDAGDIHGLSQATTSRICSRVARALARHADHYIKMPTCAEELELMRAFHNIGGFPSVTGCIGCTHIKIKKQGGDNGQYYMNTKGYYSLNIQVVCDSSLRIRDIVTRCGGSTHDAQIFNESTLKEQFEAGQFQGKLVGGSVYSLEPYLLTPILRPQSSAEEKYNEAHTAIMNVMECCFDVWKHRFQCLLHGMTGKLSNVKTTIVALAVLHNIAMDNEEISFTEVYSEETEKTVYLDSNPGLERNSAMLQDFIHKNFDELRS